MKRDMSDAAEALAQYMTPEALAVVVAHLCCATASRDKQAAMDAIDLADAIDKHLGTERYNALMEKVGL